MGNFCCRWGVIVNFLPHSFHTTSLKEPAYTRSQGGGRGRKPKPKKFPDNFLSESEGDSDDPPYSPVAVKKKTYVKARKKRDMFDEVIMSESEEEDDPKARARQCGDLSSSGAVVGREVIGGAGGDELYLM